LSKQDCFHDKRIRSCPPALVQLLLLWLGRVQLVAVGVEASRDRVVRHVGSREPGPGELPVMRERPVQVQVELKYKFMKLFRPEFTDKT
jgi:hypothetical protein